MEEHNFQDEKAIQSNPIEKKEDTLLVLHNASNGVALVQGLDEFGNLQIIMPDEKSTEPAIHIDPNEESFINFYHNFYRQLKAPLQYSFFKMT